MITVILGHAQLLAGVAREEGAQLHIEAILAGAERMNRMIEDLVEMARLEGGEFKLETEPVRLDQFLSSCSVPPRRWTSRALSSTCRRCRR
jgi:signal transduction histidine kinase